MPIDGKVYYSWKHVAESVSAMAQAVIFYRPDTLVAVGYPGWFIARALCSELGRDLPILVAQLEIHDKSSNSPIRWRPSAEWNDRTCVKTNQWFDETPGTYGERIRGRRVLIVDAIDDNRATLQAAVELINASHAPSTIGVFVLHDKLKPKVGSLSEEVIYIVAEETQHAWICYPWEAAGGSGLAAHEALARRCAGEVEASSPPQPIGTAWPRLAAVALGSALAGAAIMRLAGSRRV